MGSDHGVVLSNDKLRTLAKLVQYQEQERIKSVRFKSEKDRSDYLQLSRETYDRTMELLDDKGGAQPGNNDSAPVKKVVREYLAFIEMASGVGLQTVQNISLRKSFLTKVRAHADSYLPRMNELRENVSARPWEVVESEAEQMIEELSLYKEAMYLRTVEKADPSWRNFSKSIKLSGNSFEDLVSKYQKKLARERGAKYNASFELLEAEEKIEVYDEILKASGRGTSLKNNMYKVTDGAGKALLLLTLALSVWDIYSSEHKLQTTVKVGATVWAGYVVGGYGEIGGAAAATYLIVELGVAETVVTAGFVGLAAFVTGFGLGFIAGLTAGVFVDHIFNCGGNIKNTEATNKLVHAAYHPLISRVYVAPMPDGALLARQLCYKPAPIILVAVE